MLTWCDRNEMIQMLFNLKKLHIIFSFFFLMIYLEAMFILPSGGTWISIHFFRGGCFLLFIFALQGSKSSGSAVQLV